MKFHTYVIKRLILAVIVLFGLSILVFSLSRSAGDPVAGYVDPLTPWDQVEQIRKEHHLDEPLYIQYFYWLKEVSRGDFGICRIYMYRPVFDAITNYMPVTIELAIFTLVFMVPISFWLATKAIAHKDTWIDHLSRLLAISGRSFPVFLLGLVVLAILYPINLSIITFHYPTSDFPRITGMPTIDAVLSRDLGNFIDSIKYLIGPLLVQIFINLALTIRVLRSSMLEEAGKDYVLTGYSKGLSQDYILKNYIRRNALIPFITLMGIQFAFLMNGAVISETIFNRKGLGWLAATAATRTDHPTILAIALTLGATMVFANLAVDLIYARLDPRVTLGE